MEKTIKVIVKRPFEPVGRIREIQNTLEALQHIVGGYIETVTVASDLVIICNEEGRLLGLPYNCTIANADFVGTIIVAGKDRDEFANIPDVLTLQKWERLFL